MSALLIFHYFSIFNYAKGALAEKQRAQHKQEAIKHLSEAKSTRMDAQKKAKREAMAKRKAALAAKKLVQEHTQKEKPNIEMEAKV